MFVGQRLVEIRDMNDKEMRENGWRPADRLLVLVFENGTTIYASRAVGNGPGVLFGTNEAGGLVFVQAETDTS